MPTLGGVNITRGGMGGRKSKKESGGEFWRRRQGALDKGFPPAQAAAIAASEQAQRQVFREAANRLRAQMWPHLRRRR